MIDAQLKEKVSASLKNCTVSDAEEAAVALAVAEGNRSGQSLVIITDSQDACRGYTNGRVGRKAAGILNTGGVSNEKHQIIWAPAHEDIARNVQADLVSRGYTSRERSVAGSFEAVACTYRDILQHFKETRR
ncbi:hypothetical protein MTO96_040445 [Rhipicephalus appendiculatus]